MQYSATVDAPKTELQNKVAYLHKRLQRMESELANCG